ncbi:MAG: 6-pyruvoyl trahydropterin synthase family protein [Thermoplasmata archaeon]
MYGIGLKRVFKAKHRLDFAGAEEANPHPHPYTLEMELCGEELDENNCMIDLVEFEKIMDKVVERFEGTLLNEHPEFDENPTVEVFVELLCDYFQEEIDDEDIEILKLKLWEGEEAFASYRREVD